MTGLQQENHEPEECLGFGDERVPCKGTVEYRWNGYNDGKSSLRCAAHGDAQIDRANDPNSVAKYADSDVPPSWFDPTIAGERWDEDY